MKVNGSTVLVGLIGNPVSHSLSPAMHNAAYAHLTINACYVPLLVEDDQVGQAVNGLRALGFAGANVTVPHKQAVIPFLDEVDPHALAINSVNTIVHRDGMLKGYSTDGPGLIHSYKAELGYEVAGNAAVVMGAGGSSSAVCFALLDAGVSSLVVYNRSRDRLDALVKMLHSAFPDTSIRGICAQDNDGWATVSDSLGSADLVVNTTSLGMKGSVKDSPFEDFDWIGSQKLCSDIIYAPAETVFLKAARDKGVATLNGLGMLVGQGALGFELFLGQKPDYNIMRNEILL